METYSLSMGTDVVCRILNVDPQEMLQKAGLAGFAHGPKKLRVTAQQYFTAWNTAVQLTEFPDYVNRLGIGIARGPIIPVFFALTCAPNLEIGAGRLVQFKALLGPTIMKSYWDRDELRIEYHSADPTEELPASLAALHLVLSVEQVRAATASHVRPLSATLNAPEEERRKFASLLGVMPQPGDIVALNYSKTVAQHPFVSENSELWDLFEKDLEERILAQRGHLPIVDRIRAILVDLMSSGRANVDDVCFELSLSRSTLQRRLREEGRSFQDVLNETRRELAIRYLTKSTLQVDQISAMLGYRDPNSFSRGFRRWTGQAPNAFRAQSKGR